MYFSQLWELTSNKYMFNGKLLQLLQVVLVGKHLTVTKIPTVPQSSVSEWMNKRSPTRLGKPSLYKPSLKLCMWNGDRGSRWMTAHVPETADVWSSCLRRLHVWGPRRCGHLSPRRGHTAPRRAASPQTAPSPQPRSQRALLVQLCWLIITKSPLEFKR